MKAEIKKMHSPDIQNLTGFYPEVEDNFGFLLQMFVGPKGEQGFESFDLIVCTPKWLISSYEEKEMVFGLHHLIAFEYNYEKIYNKLKRYVERFDEPDWSSLAMKIGRISRWEFQDYQQLED